VQTPTNDREAIYAAIDRMQLQRATATGSGLIVSLATLFPGRRLRRQHRGVRARGAAQRAHRRREEGSQEGFQAGAAGLLQLRGDHPADRRPADHGPDPIEIAKMAADRGVRVYTVGFGTTSGEVIGFEGWSFRVRLDEETLKTIATMTQGEYFHAGSAADLKKVYETLNSRLSLEKKETEVTALFSAAAALFTLLAGLLSILWFNRIL
jgi:Ca-activated chloride channel family protein